MYARLTVRFALVLIVSTPSLFAQQEWAELTDHLRTVNGVFEATAVADVDIDGDKDLDLLLGTTHTFVVDRGQGPHHTRV